MKVRGENAVERISKITFSRPGAFDALSFPFSSFSLAKTPPELNVWSGCITFTAPPFFPSEEEEEGKEVGRADKTYTFAVFGDMGTAEEDGSTNMVSGEVSSQMGRQGFE